MASSSKQTEALERLGPLSREFAPQALDLTDSAAALQFDVKDYDWAAFELAGSNAVAILEVQRSRDGGANWEAFDPWVTRKGSGAIRGVPCDQANALRLKVETADGSGTTENVQGYADQVAPVQRERVLAQLRPGDTLVNQLWAPDVYGFVTRIAVAGTTTGQPATRIFIDADGTTADETTAHWWDVPVYNKQPVNYPVGVGIARPGSIWVRIDTLDAVTFTAYGWEV